VSPVRTVTHAYDHQYPFFTWRSIVFGNKGIIRISQANSLPHLVRSDN
jgi:hypothetical protein